MRCSVPPPDIVMVYGDSPQEDPCLLNEKAYKSFKITKGLGFELRLELETTCSALLATPESYSTRPLRGEGSHWVSLGAIENLK